jgi:molybdopterin-guanine dinucleotide biosynthesis protein A
MRPAGIVLAGGRSERMGTPKAWLDWHGQPLLARVVAIVARAVRGPVVVVGAAGQTLPALPGDVVVIADARPGVGPLQGIGSGLAALAGAADVAYVSSTDAALLHPAFVRRVVAGVTDGVDALVPEARGFRQPLAAAYRVEVAATIEQLIAEDRAKPRFLYERMRTRFADERWLLADPAIAAADPALDSLVNPNDPDEFAAALARPLPLVEVDGRGPVRALTVRQASPAAARAVVDGGEVGPDFPLAAGDRIRLD